MNDESKRQARLIFKQLGVLDCMARALGSIRAPDSDDTGVSEDLATIYEAIDSMRSKLVQLADGAGLYDEPYRVAPSTDVVDDVVEFYGAVANVTPLTDDERWKLKGCRSPRDLENLESEVRGARDGLLPLDWGDAIRDPYNLGTDVKP